MRPLIWTRQPQVATRSGNARGLISLASGVEVYPRDSVSGAQWTATATNRTRDISNSGFGGVAGTKDGTAASLLEGPTAKLNAMWASSGAASLVAVVRSVAVGGHGSGSWPAVSLRANTGIAEHYPFTDGALYIGPFSATRWVSAVAPIIDIFKPHVIVVTHRSGEQRFYLNGRLLASAAIAETPSVLSYGFGDAGAFYSAAAFNVVLTAAEIAAYSVNPWQLFAPLPRRIWAPVTAAGGLSGQVNESVAFADAQSAQADFSATGAESVAFADAQSAAAVFAATQAETVAFTDAQTGDIVGGGTTYSATLDEAVAFADAQSAQAVFAAAQAETVAFTDAQSAAAVFAATQTDTVAFADDQTANLGPVTYTGAVSESIGFLDGQSATLSDTATATPGRRLHLQAQITPRETDAEKRERRSAQGTLASFEPEAKAAATPAQASPQASPQDVGAAAYIASLQADAGAAQDEYLAQDVSEGLHSASVLRMAADQEQQRQAEQDRLDLDIVFVIAMLATA